MSTLPFDSSSHLIVLFGASDHHLLAKMIEGLIGQRLRQHVRDVLFGIDFANFVDLFLEVVVTNIMTSEIKMFGSLRYFPRFRECFSRAGITVEGDLFDFEFALVHESACEYALFRTFEIRVVFRFTSGSANVRITFTSPCDRSLISERDETVR